MTTLVTEVGSLRHLPLSPIVLRKIAGFLAAGNTGKIILNVKDGQVRSFELNEVGDARCALNEQVGANDANR